MTGDTPPGLTVSPMSEVTSQRVGGGHGPMPEPRPVGPIPNTKIGPDLNADQQVALGQILAANQPGNSHVLTGFAGSGKTTLIGVVTDVLRQRGTSVVVSAPTHKAVAVIAGKLQAAGDDVPCLTVHSLLSLNPRPHADRLIFERRQNAPPVLADVVIIDECSMIDTNLLDHIRRWLPNSFVLFVGDPAQLPPVGEAASKTFDTPGRSHLDTIVRQAADNPILVAAGIIRASQGGPLDWSWVRSANRPPFGVFRPGPAVDQWMRQAFTGDEFQNDPDTFRHLAWTNARVAEINQRVRHWVYGDAAAGSPFLPGEHALIRAPVIIDDKSLFNTNEEVTVLSIEPDVSRFEFLRRGNLAGWTTAIPSWGVTLRADDGRVHQVHAVRDERIYEATLDRVADEAAIARKRWAELHAFKASMARMQPIYAMTIHNSQGSTFKNVFLDLADIARRAPANVLETQQLLYVGATRPTHGLFLVENWP